MAAILTITQSTSGKKGELLFYEQFKYNNFICYRFGKYKADVLTLHGSTSDYITKLNSIRCIYKIKDLDETICATKLDNSQLLPVHELIYL